ncbi:hypothetical protein [Alteromonas facilis]|uniref:hypothetical protein n=1 Tax=Alteromonas facilis TaxID=2048004 RepID=UPI000C28FC14|nr:hypothetical protein [Alteromonas facilis]
MRTLFIGMLWLVSFVGVAQTSINESALGNFELTYTQVESLDEYPITAISGQIRVREGDIYSLTAPINPQQRIYLVGDGGAVTAGQRIAHLIGSEVHHFRERLDAQRLIVSQAEQRYNKNQALFKQQAISQERWQQIMAYYFEQKLMLGHLEHFAEWVEFTDSYEEMYLLSPIAGLLRHTPISNAEDGVVLAKLVPLAQARANANVPISAASKVSALRFGNCVVDVDSFSANASGVTADIWSQPLNDDCGFTLGQSVELTPVVEQPIMRIPKASIYMFEGNTYVAKLEGTILTPVAVSVRARSDATNMYIEAQPLLVNARVLSSSVSALQGILMGMGGE